MDNKAKKIEMKDLVDYCNNYGFIFQGSEIYGGLANTWDYGPLGSRLKNTIKDAWRYFFIQKRDNAYEVDADILMNPRVWEASGHVQSFSDPLVDCKECIEMASFVSFQIEVICIFFKKRSLQACF